MYVVVYVVVDHVVCSLRVVVDVVLSQTPPITPPLQAILQVGTRCTEIMTGDMEIGETRLVRDPWRGTSMRWTIIMRRFLTLIETSVLERRGWDEFVQETRVMIRLRLLDLTILCV